MSAYDNAIKIYIGEWLTLHICVLIENIYCGFKTKQSWLINALINSTYLHVNALEGLYEVV